MDGENKRENDKSEKNEFSDDFRERIKREYVQPTFIADIGVYLKERRLYRRWGNRFELLGKILTFQ